MCEKKQQLDIYRKTRFLFFLELNLISFLFYLPIAGCGFKLSIDHLSNEQMLSNICLHVVMKKLVWKIVTNLWKQDQQKLFNFENGNLDFTCTLYSVCSPVT